MSSQNILISKRKPHCSSLKKTAESVYCTIGRHRKQMQVASCQKSCAQCFHFSRFPLRSCRPENSSHPPSCRTQLDPLGGKDAHCRSAIFFFPSISVLPFVILFFQFLYSSGPKDHFICFTLRHGSPLLLVGIDSAYYLKEIKKPESR